MFELSNLEPLGGVGGQVDGERGLGKQTELYSISDSLGMLCESLL